MRNATEIAAELLEIESRSKGALMKTAAATLMEQIGAIGQLNGMCARLKREVEQCRHALPAGHPRNDYERVSRAAEILESYCATHTCSACPLSPACRGMGMELPRMLNCVAEVVEKPRLVEQFASDR